jgi:hypothetical protein
VYKLAEIVPVSVEEAEEQNEQNGSFLCGIRNGQRQFLPESSMGNAEMQLLHLY